MPELKRLPAVFYALPSGKEPVREWLLEFDIQNRRTIGLDIATAEFGWPVGMPVCKAMGGGLYEIRSNISSGRIARVLFCIEDGHMVLLHGFVKKTQKAPKSDLELGMQRMKEVKS